MEICRGHGRLGAYGGHRMLSVMRAPNTKLESQPPGESLESLRRPGWGLRHQPPTLKEGEILGTPVGLTLVVDLQARGPWRLDVPVLPGSGFLLAVTGKG